MLKRGGQRSAVQFSSPPVFNVSPCEILNTKFTQINLVLVNDCVSEWMSGWVQSSQFTFCLIWKENSCNEKTLKIRWTNLLRMTSIFTENIDDEWMIFYYHFFLYHSNNMVAIFIILDVWWIDNCINAQRKIKLSWIRIHKNIVKYKLNSRWI